MAAYKFNIRVYGILINKENEVFVTDEYRMGLAFTKFPGGGLEFGEGTLDCLRRECREEIGEEIEIINHFYTTDYFQSSAFNEKHQLISIYYLISSKGIINRNFRSVRFEFSDKIDGAQIFRWVPVKELNAEDFMFPVDKIVVNKIKENLNFTKT